MVTLILICSFVGYQIVHAATGGGTATIAKDGGTAGAGVSVERATSHIFTTTLTIDTLGMTLGASSPTFTIPNDFTVPTTHPVATAGGVDADGKWSVTTITGGGCAVDSSPSAPITVAAGW